MTTTENPPEAQPGAEQHPHVYGAMWSLMRDVAWVGKTETMDQGKGGNYAFRSVEQVIAALGSRARAHGLALGSRHVAGPEYAEHEVPWKNGQGSTRWTTCRGLVIEYSWTSLVDGSTVSAIGVGEGRDSSDKATNKAMTAAYKYALTQSTMLPTFDPDPDGDQPEVDTEHQGGGAPDAPADPEPERTPGEVLNAIRNADSVALLGDIYYWLEDRQLLDDEHDGQTFRAHLEAARAILDPEQAQGGGG